jgi:hypothetical protein
MFFNDSDLHDCMKASLEVLLDLSRNGKDDLQRGNAAVALANLVLEIFDRQNGLEVVDLDAAEDEDDEYEY